MKLTYDLVVTRHPVLVEYLLELGLITSETAFVAHVDEPSCLEGLHVVGILPSHLAARCKTHTEIPLKLTLEDRSQELTLERDREIAGEPVTYVTVQIS